MFATTSVSKYSCVYNYLRYVPADYDEHSLNFWKQGLYPYIQKAKSHLNRSAAE